MTEPPLTNPPIDYSTWLPLDTGADQAGDLPPDSLGGFSYIGKGLTPDEFSTYLQSYNFGTIPPDYIVLHHTAVPTMAQWTAGEAGLNEPQIKQKRLDVLHGLMVYYRDKLGWSAGPHLFIDDHYIWLFSEMNEPGIHAMWGNSHHNGGQLHYSIGIEVVGNYEQQQWPEKIANLVDHTIAILKQKLGTFDLRYLYPDEASKPGRKQVGVDKHGNLIWACAHPDRLRWGGITSHRDYNKPECPGAAITEDYYTSVLTNAMAPHVGQVAQSKVHTVASDGLNLRAAPGAAQPSVAILPHGTAVTLLNESQTVNGGTWVKVQAGGTVGWVNQRFLT